MAWRRRSSRSTRRSSRSRRGNAADGEVQVRSVHETYAEELAGSRPRCRDVAARDTAGREIGVLVRDNAHAADVFDALTAAGVPVEIVGLNGLLRLPEVAEVVATLHPARRRHRQRRAAHTAAPGRAGRSARATSRCSGGARASWPGRGPRPRPRRRVWTRSSPAPSPAPTPPMSSRSSTRSRTRGTCRTPGGARAVRAARDRAARLRGMVGEPLLDLVRRIIDTCGIDVELASSVSEAARARRDNLDLFVKAVAEFQAVDGDVSLGGAARLARGRGRLGQRPRRRHPDRGRLGQAADRPPGQGPGVGRRSSWSGVCDTRVPATPGPRAVADLGVDPARRRCAVTADDLPQLLTPRQGRARAACRADTRRTRRPRSCRLGYVAFTRAAHRLSCRRTSGRPAARRSGRRSTRATVREAAEAWGEPVAAGSRRRSGRRRTRYAAGPVEYRGRSPSSTAEARRRLAAAELVRDGRSRRGRRRRPDATRTSPRSPTGTPSSSGCSPRRGTEPASVEMRSCPAACRRPRCCGCGTTRTAFARELARPMPRPPSRGDGSARSSTPGSRRASASSRCSTPTTCPGAPTSASTTTPTSTR